MILTGLALAAALGLLGYRLEENGWTFPAVISLAAAILCLELSLALSIFWISGRP